MLRLVHAHPLPEAHEALPGTSLGKDLITCHFWVRSNFLLVAVRLEPFLPREANKYSVAILLSYHLQMISFDAMQVPEMARVPLEELVMQIHLLGQGPAALFLAGVLQPPPPRSIQAAVAHLQSLNALTPEEQLTPLGTLLFPSSWSRSTDLWHESFHNVLAYGQSCT